MVYKPDSVLRCYIGAITIYLDLLLPADSSVFPMHSTGLRLAPSRVCQVPAVADRLQLQLDTSREQNIKHQSAFHLSSRRGGISIVSVALSLGFLKRRDTCSFRFIYILAAVSRFRFHHACAGIGARTFLPHSCEQRRSSVLPSWPKITEKGGFDKAWRSTQTIDKDTVFC